MKILDLLIYVMEMILPRLGVVRVAIKMPPGRLPRLFLLRRAVVGLCMTASLSHLRDGVTNSVRSFGHRLLSRNGVEKQEAPPEKRSHLLTAVLSPNKNNQI